MTNQPNPPRRISSDTSSSLSNIAKGLGSILSWQFHGKSWTPDEIRDFVSSLNMDSYLTVKDIPATNGMHNAISLFRDISKNDEPIKADKVHGDQDTGLYTIAILEREADPTAKRSKYDTIDKVVFDVKNGTFLFNGKTDHAFKLCQEIKFRSTHYTGNEFRKWVIMPLLNRWNAIRVMGGAYYISNKYQSEVDNLERLCKLCGVTLNILDQMNTQRTASTIANAGKMSLMERIEAINTQLEKWQGKKRIRKDGSDNVLKELKDIIASSKLLEETLQISLGDVTNAIEEATREALDLIKGQSTKPVTSKKVLSTWKNALKEEYKVGDSYLIPFSDISKLNLPNVAKNPHYYKTGKRLAVALFELGFIGRIKNDYITLTPLQ